MKIALSFPAVNRRGGIERVLYETARYLGNHGHDVHLFSHDVDAVPQLPVTLHPVPMRKSPWWISPLSFQRNCTMLLRPAEYDAVGSFGAPSPLGGIYWLPSVHKAWLEYSAAHRPPLSASRLKQRLNPYHPAILHLEKQHFAPGGYRRLLAQTAAVKADVQRLYSVPDADVDVLPIGYDPAEFDHSRAVGRRAQMRQRLGYQPSDKVLIFVANELQRKGFAVLIEAIAQLAEPRPKLLVVGRVTVAPYTKRVQELGLTDSIQFVGSTDDVAAFYAAADAFVLPTQYEAWGLVIVEAMACGLPVLTSRLAGASVAVNEGVSGFLLDDPEDLAAVTTGLRRLLAGEHAAPQQISDSVHAYEWGEILPGYEAALREY